MPTTADNLATLKDDMIAFIEGHGMRRFQGYVDYEEVPSVMWKPEGNPDGWKDFVELAKAANAPFLTMDSWTLTREDFEEILERLKNAEFANDEDMEEVRWLRTYLGKTGFVQLGFAHQGVMMVYNRPRSGMSVTSTCSNSPRISAASPWTSPVRTTNPKRNACVGTGALASLP